MVWEEPKEAQRGVKVRAGIEPLLMRLLAISDLHVGHAPNREALLSMPAHPADWLAVVGDIGETLEHLSYTFDVLSARFAKLIWVPGNHELYTVTKDSLRAVGEERYQGLVEFCRGRGVLTPEDPWPLWPGEGPPTLLAPAFVGYDYSFAPAGMSAEQARRWAAEDGIFSADERYIRSDPYPDLAAWCQERVWRTEARLSAVPAGHRVVLFTHYPLLREHVRLHMIPRFTPWCGTTLTANWHRRFPIDVVVYGHLHMRCTEWQDGVRFEEVALGYPRHWKQEKGIGAYIREILPRVPAPAGGNEGPRWHR